MRLRAVFVAALMAALTVPPIPAVAGSTAIADPNDLSHRLDIRRAVHGHGRTHRTLQHGVRTYGKWKPRTLRHSGWRVELRFEVDADPAADRAIRVRHDGSRLVATYFGGRRLRERLPAEIRVWRPDNRSVKVSFRAGLLKKGLRRYRWQAEVYRPNTTCTPEVPCEDEAPDRGWVRHRI